MSPLLFVNHFPNWQLNLELERAVAAARFVEERVSRKPQHVVMVGDLDADPEAASIRLVRPSIVAWYKRLLPRRLGRANI